jgi:hypothetical protein
MPARHPDLLLLAALVLLGSLLTPALASPTAAAQRGPEPIDLASIILTTTDLEREGLEGYGVIGASPYTLPTDAAVISAVQGLDEEEVTETLEDAGYVGSYVLSQHVPADPDAPAGESSRRLVSRVYAFEDEDGAAAAFEVIADESEMAENEAEDTDLRIGDEAELTSLAFEEDNFSFGVPYNQLELEILYDRLVLEVSALDFEVTRRTNPDRVEGEAVTALGERLVERAEAALEGDAPDLWLRTLKLEGDSGIAPYLAYDLLDGDPIRTAFETDDAFVSRVEGDEEAGMVSYLSQQQLLTEGTSAEGAIRYYNNFLRFESPRAASAYLDDSLDRLAARYGDAEEIELPDDLGDASLGVSFEFEFEGERYPISQLLVQINDEVVILWIEQDLPTDAQPEVSPDLLVELGEAQVECVEEESCTEPVPMPDELVEIIEGGSDSDARDDPAPDDDDSDADVDSDETPASDDEEDSSAGD